MFSIAEQATKTLHTTVRHMPRFTGLVESLKAESAFTVLARARSLRARGKEVVELEIGDSPFPTTPSAKAAGIAAIEANRTGYAPSLGIPELREAAARFVRGEFGIDAKPENIAVSSGAKPFEQFFSEAFLEPGDGVLIFTPHFPTYEPNLARRGARAVLEPLSPGDGFRPNPAAVERFLRNDAKPRSIWLNSPHNPTGGVATKQDLAAIADLVRGTDIVVFSDEPYCHMLWGGERHHSILEMPGMFEHALAAYTFSKSYSMSGWRIGFAVASPEVVSRIGNLNNTALSCSPPFVQMAAAAALEHDRSARDDYMSAFSGKVKRLAHGLAKIRGVKVEPPAGTFYVFPDVRPICQRLGLSSQGLALYLLEGADDDFGVACLGGECFGPAGLGFLRFSCAESDERIAQAIDFLPHALERDDRARRYLANHPELAWAE
jgi:aspartate aminotransferase